MYITTYHSYIDVLFVDYLDFQLAARSYTVTVRFGRLPSRTAGFSAPSALATKLALPLVLTDSAAHPVVGYS